jgi:hypothetical protein
MEVAQALAPQCQGLDGPPIAPLKGICEVTDGVDLILFSLCVRQRHEALVKIALDNANLRIRVSELSRGSRCTVSNSHFVIVVDTGTNFGLFPRMSNAVNKAVGIVAAAFDEFRPRLTCTDA